MNDIHSFSFGERKTGKRFPGSMQLKCRSFGRLSFWMYCFIVSNRWKCQKKKVREVNGKKAGESEREREKEEFWLLDKECFISLQQFSTSILVALQNSTIASHKRPVIANELLSLHFIVVSLTLPPPEKQSKVSKAVQEWRSPCITWHIYFVIFVACDGIKFANSHSMKLQIGWFSETDCHLHCTLKTHSEPYQYHDAIYLHQNGNQFCRKMIYFAQFFISMKKRWDLFYL